MKKYWRILPISLIISILCTSTGLVSYARNISTEASAGEFVVYVSPDGDDSGDGTPENMLRTPAGAKAYVRESGVLRKRPVRVIFKPGNYYLEEGIVFEASDAGTEDCPIVWEAETKGTAHFYGTTVLDNSLFEPVTDQAILNKIPTNAQDKVVQLDLKKMNIDIDLPRVYTWDLEGSNQPYVGLFNNGADQMLSRWPNGECQYAIWDKVLYKGSSSKSSYVEDGGAVIQFSNPRMVRWTEAKHAFLRGHTGCTWACENLLVKEFNAEKKTITFRSTPKYYIEDASPREMQIFNILEEIDCATEWYIDPDTDILYYYPPKEITMEDEIELTTFKDRNMIEFKSGADMHMTLKGIDISRSRGRALYIAGTHVNVDNCIITYIKARNAVSVYSDKFNLTNNYIAMCDGAGMYVEMSDEAANDRTAKRSQVINNYLTQISSMTVNGGHAMNIRGRHIDVKYNTVHNVPSGCTYGGPFDARIQYNEFYNFGKDTTDVGAYYSGMGRTGTTLDIDFSKNFIYDYGTANKNLGDAIQGIYFDDGNCFGIARNNILVNGARSGVQIGGGDRNIIEGNIILQMGGSNMSTDNRRESWATGNDMLNTAITGVNQTLTQRKHFAKIDPYLNSYLSLEYHLQPMDNIIRYNLADKPFEFNARMVEFGRVYDNKSVDDYSHFVDPDKYDFRLKDDSPYAKMIPELTESNFDLWSVGTSMEVTEGIDKSIQVLYPVNDGQFNSVSDMLTWSKTNMADDYRVLVATDSEMKNIIVDEIVPYNSVSIDGFGLEEGKDYWWRVEVINRSFKRKSTWGTEINKFTNTVNYISAVDTIKVKVEENKKLMADNDLNLYGEEEIKALRKVNDKGMKVHQEALKSGVIYKDDYDNIIFELDNAVNKFEGSEKLNFTHISTEDITNPDLWLESNEVIKDVNGTRLLLKRIGQTNIMFDKDIGQSDIIQFRAKIDYNPNGGIEGTFASFDLRRQDYKKIGWSDSRSVMFIMKKHKIELQIYPKGTSALVAQAENKWDVDGKWHDYAIGVINKPDGARILMMIDGEIAIDYRHYNNLIHDPGKFAILLAGVDAEIEESQLGALETNPSAANCFVGGVNHSEEGMWTKSQIPGFRGSYVKQIASGSGTATWKFENIGGKKKVYFRKVVAPDGDKNAKLEVYSDKVWTMGGDEVTTSFPIDMSSGEDEWILIDSGLFNQGTLEIKLTGSGSGTLYANAVRFEEMEE